MTQSQHGKSRIITGPISGLVFGAMVGIVVAFLFYFAWQATPKGHNSFGVLSFVMIGVMGLLSLPWGILFWALSSASFETAACTSIFINFCAIYFLVGLYRAKRMRK